jgi:hypothetical protein
MTRPQINGGIETAGSGNVSGVSRRDAQGRFRDASGRFELSTAGAYSMALLSQTAEPSGIGGRSC